MTKQLITLLCDFDKNRTGNKIPCPWQGECENPRQVAVVEAAKILPSSDDQVGNGFTFTVQCPTEILEHS